MVPIIRDLDLSGYCVVRNVPGRVSKECNCYSYPYQIRIMSNESAEQNNGEFWVRDFEPTNMALLGRMKSGAAGAWSEFDQFHRGLIIH